MYLHHGQSVKVERRVFFAIFPPVLYLTARLNVCVLVYHVLSSAMKRYDNTTTKGYL